MTQQVPDRGMIEKTQAFPRYRLGETKDEMLGGGFEVSEANGYLHGQDCGDGTGRIWLDNITDTALQQYRTHYPDESIVKDDIFFYVYGMLHHEGYRAKYKNDLKKELPRIPMAPDFRSFADIGRQLAELHCGYETLPGWNDSLLEWELSPEAQAYLAAPEQDRPAIDETDPDNDSIYLNPLYCEKKPQFADNCTTLKLNRHITLRNIPPDAHAYKLAGKSPLETFAKEYHRKTDTKTEIVNDRNLLFKHNPEQLLTRIRQLIQVGVETEALVCQLPDKFEPVSLLRSKNGSK